MLKAVGRVGQPIIRERLHEPPRGVERAEVERHGVPEVAFLAMMGELPRADVLAQPYLGVGPPDPARTSQRVLQFQPDREGALIELAGRC